MTIKQWVGMLVLAALWGASFLFLRLATPSFGPVALVALRIGIGGVLLVLVVIIQKKGAELWRHRKHLFIASIIQTAVPFSLFGVASLQVPAGVMSVMNGTSPLWTALVAALWLKEYLSFDKVCGLVIGFLGVILLVLSTQNASAGQISYVLLCLPLVATLHYGIGANYTKKYLLGISPMVVAAGSIFGSTVITTPLAFIYWPEVTPTEFMPWASAIGLAVLCTSLAFIIFFQLIQSIGPIKTVSVTFMVPVFGIIWGAIFLQEPYTWMSFMATLVILVSMGLTMGLFKCLYQLFR